MGMLQIVSVLHSVEECAAFQRHEDCPVLPGAQLAPPVGVNNAATHMRLTGDSCVSAVVGAGLPPTPACGSLRCMQLRAKHSKKRQKAV